MNITVIGCGGVGSWAAYFIAKYAEQQEKVCTLSLIDGDLLEAKNVGRILPSDNAIGVPKVSWLASYTSRPNVTVKKYPTKFYLSVHCILLDDVDVVVCATDTVDIQRQLHTYCRQKGKRYIRAGYDGNTINVTKQFALTLEDNEVENADAGYHAIPTIIPAAIAGALAAYHVWYPEDAPSVLGELNRIAISGNSYIPPEVGNEYASKWASEQNMHKDDECNHEDCISADDGGHYRDDCDHSDCISTEDGHSYDDCDHSDCVSATYEDTLDYVENIHENHRNKPNCPFCERDNLQDKVNELQAQLDKIEEGEPS